MENKMNIKKRAYMAFFEIGDFAFLGIKDHKAIIFSKIEMERKSC